MDGRFVFFKVPETDTVIPVDVTPLLLPGESVMSVVLGDVQPVTVPALTAVLQSAVTNPQTLILLQGGANGVSYGINISVTTNARTFLVTCAITAQDPSFVPYVTENPQAYNDLVDTIEAGNAAVGSTVFSFPGALDVGHGFVTWELLDKEGVVYSAGNAFSYTVQNTGLANIVIAQSIITVPSTVPPSLEGQKYQLRYTLELPEQIGLPVDPTTGGLGQNKFFQFESINVVGLNTVPLGTQPQVELAGVPATLSICVDKPYDNVTLEVWSGNQQIAPQTSITDYERTSSGYVFSGVIDTKQMPVTLEPYTVIWKYWATNNAAYVNQESADLWIVNPSIMTAISDVKAKINKARTTLYGTPDLLYPAPTILTWLRRGMDAFNGAYGQFTSFTMTNARGPIREYWLLYAEVAAIQSQYLAEGEKAFNYQGAAISLEVDRTQYLDNAARTIQARLDNEVKDVKTNLIIKGAMRGDGSVDPTRLQQGAIGSVGISITPASMWGRFSPSYGLGGAATVANSYG